MVVQQIAVTTISNDSVITSMAFINNARHWPTQPDYYFRSTIEVATRLLGSGGTPLQLLQRYCEGTL